MKLLKLAFVLCGAPFAWVAAGCAVDATPPAPEGHSATAADATPTSKAAGTVLATVTQQGHTFVFGRSLRGDYVVEEVAPVGEAPVLRQEDVAGRSITDVFTRISGGAPVPDALANAPAASFDPSEPVAIAPPPSREVQAESLTMISTLTPTQQWFKNSFCAPTLSYMTTCDVSTTAGSINTNQSQWVYDANYFSYAVNDPASTSAGAMLEYFWNGSGWKFDWISSSINPGNYVYQYWWNSGPVFRSSELANQGLGGMAMGGIMPDNVHPLHVGNPIGGSYFEVNIGGSKMKADWANDNAVDCYVGSIRITAPGSGLYFGSGGTGENINMNSVCPPQQWYNSTPWSAFCRGKTTGQTLSTTVLAPYFAPANCCASMGGGNHGC